MRLAPCTLTLLVALRAGLASADESPFPARLTLRAGATESQQPQTLRAISFRDLSVREELTPAVQPPDRWVNHVSTDKLGFKYTDSFRWNDRKFGFGVKGPVLGKTSNGQQNVGSGSRFGLLFELRF
jgi:hypothetical protein